MVWLVGCNSTNTDDTVRRSAAIMPLRSYISMMWPLHAYFHHSGRLGPAVAPVQIPLDL